MSDRLREAKGALEAHRTTSSRRKEVPNLFDAETARDASVSSVGDTYRGELLAELDQTLERVAGRMTVFTIDDVRDEMTATHVAAGVDLRVLGAVVRRAAKRGRIRPVGYRPSRYRHASPLRLWQVCDGT